MDDKRLPEEPVEESGAPSKSAALADRPRSWSRRRFGVAAVSASVIMSLHAQPLRAANCTPSGWVSGNSSLHPEPESCGGETPEYWRQAAYNGTWPSPYEPGDGVNDQHHSVLQDEDGLEEAKLPDGSGLRRPRKRLGREDEANLHDSVNLHDGHLDGDTGLRRPRKRLGLGEVPSGDGGIPGLAAVEDIGSPFWGVNAFTGGEYGGRGYWNYDEHRSMSLFEVLNGDDHESSGMGQHAVAALLNAASMKIPLTVLEVQEMFNAALAGEPYLNDHLAEPMTPDQVLAFFEATYTGAPSWQV